MSVVYPVRGGCLCGAIRYALSIAPESVGICHCRSCRRAAGAESVAWLTVEIAGFAVERGRIAEFASSPGITRGFCATCGTTLTYRRDTASIDVTLGSLDDPETFPPEEEVWAEERLSWNPADLNLPQRIGDG